MSLNKSIITIRVKLQKSNLKKSGVNKFAGFKYFELADFLPKLNELMLEEEVNDLFTIENNKASLTLIKGEETQTYTIPFIVYETPTNKTGQPQMQDIQYLGALNTYYKRYLYLNAFGITDGEIIDALDNYNAHKEEKKETKATPSQIAKVLEVVSNIPQMLLYYKIEKIEDLTVKQASNIIANAKK